MMMPMYSLIKEDGGRGYRGHYLPMMPIHSLTEAAFEDEGRGYRGNHEPPLRRRESIDPLTGRQALVIAVLGAAAIMTCFLASIG